MSDEAAKAAKATNDWNAGIIEEFRANQGVVGGPFEGAPVLLLQTSGAKTNATRTNPMMYLEQDGKIFVFASKAGADSNPDWYRNLVAHPKVTVELGTDTFDAEAKVLEGAQRDQVYEAQAKLRPQFAEYQEKTSRVIPVVELVRS
jgi:deazaflavin-dependent oxidoreductase (nitroreductase family)